MELNVKYNKTIKLLEESLGENLCDFSLNKDFYAYNTKCAIHKKKKKEMD